MTASLAGRVRLAVSPWRHPDSMHISADPADVESATVRHTIHAPLPAWFLPRTGGPDVRPAEQHICAWQGRTGSAAWRLRLRRKRLPSGYLAGVLATVTGLVAVPDAEGLWRCARAGKR